MSDEKVVYVIRHPHDYYKIGISKRPRSRMAELQIGTPYDLSLVGVIECNAKASQVEAKLHDRYTNKRGEWFKLDDRQLQSLLRLEQFGDPAIKWRYEDAEERKRETLKMQGLIG